MKKYAFSLIAIALILFPNCYKEPYKKSASAAPRASQHKEAVTFNVENKTENKIYTCCFYYARRATGTRWTWYKTNVVPVDIKEEATVTVPLNESFADHKEIQGCLAVFKDKVEADSSILELLKDEQSLELGMLEKLNHKTVTIVASQYGFKGEELAHDIISITDEKKANMPPKEAALPELDFYVENKTGKDLLITCFVYELVGAHRQWDFEKLPLQHVKNNASIFFDVATIARTYEWQNVRAYLGIFNTDEKEEAQQTTYETLTPSHKVGLGLLRKLQGKKIVIIPKVYGILGGFDERHPEIEFTIKPVNRNIVVEAQEKTKTMLSPYTIYDQD